MDTVKAEELLESFITEILQNQTVWGLTNTKRWATGSSVQDKTIEVLVFWSTEDQAQKMARKEWADLYPSSIPLIEFLENWCAGMYEDVMLAGINWSDQLEGVEIEPLDLIIKILQKIKSYNLKLQYQQFEDVDDFLGTIQAMRDEELEG